MAQRIRRTARRQTVNGQVELLQQIAGRDKGEFLKLLPNALSNRSARVRDAAVRLVTEYRLTEAARLVERLLRDKNEDVRYDAAECVGFLQEGRKSSPSGLRDLLRDKSWLLRAQALENLALLEDNGALPDVVRLLSDEVPIVRSYAAGTVGMLGGLAYLKNLRRGLIREKHESARVGFYEALFLLGRREVLPEMLMLLQSSDYHVRCAVANALEAMPLRAPEAKLAIAALATANREPCAVADETTIRRVLKALRKHKSR